MVTETFVGQLPALEMTISAGVHLFTDRWLEHCEKWWDATPQKLRFTSGGDTPTTVEAAYYLNRNGRIWKPASSPGPYLSVTLDAPAEIAPAAREAQWLEVGQALAVDMRDRGLAGSISLPPTITDMRPWQQAGFRIEVLYTYCVDLPYDETLMRPQVRRVIRKAEKSGFTCSRSRNMQEVYDCLAETQERQGFDLGVSAEDLVSAQRALGADKLRGYVAYSPEGEAVSATLEVHAPGRAAVGWLAGTKWEYLRTGVAQLLNRYVLEDLAAAGATSYDLAGANLPSVAYSKSQWGATVKPFYRIEGDGAVDVARHARKYWRFQRARS